MQEEIQTPNEVTATAKDNTITIKGPKGEVQRTLKEPSIKLKTENNTIKITCKKGTKRQKRVINSFAAHIENMIKGVQEPYKYVLKICSGHFPMNVSVNGDKLIIKNFLGEKSPRTLTLKKGADVKIDGEIITVESPNKELAGQVASDIELLTAKTNRDLRVFQDGIYLVEKAGNKVIET
ncbi:50S ribosomal protein L6 [Candidatus Woesearchaeota archaeon]|nr:50S ribosomal protein L6 [Candidatus Woesearchaeota archaeon]MBW3016552.1 50S ribosomal protein L6 [Candidatus Woesearchaeota archaeon]